MRTDLIFRLAVHDLRSRCLGSLLGFLWAFVQPLVMTIILWFVVSVAFNAQAGHGVPFIAWLLAGMSVWAFFADALSQATGVFCEYAFLLRKVNFRIAILPLVKLVSALAVHLVFLALVFCVLIFSRIEIAWSWLALVYYLFAAFVFSAALAYLTAPLHVFFRDVGQIVNVALQFGFWVTPVFWDFSRLQGHPGLAFLLRLNPVVYFVEGYRNALLFKAPFAGGWPAAVYFWGVTLLLLLAGGLLFRKLRPQFADVL